MSPLDLLRARLDLIEHARPSVDYCRTSRIDWTLTQPYCGGVYIAPAQFDLPWFDIVEDGEEVAVVETLAEDGVTVVDLVAWPIDDPTRFATAIGAAAVLGENVASNPVTYFAGAPLRLFRSPLTWLQAGCDGAVILDQARGARWLLELPSSRIAAEDDEHADQLMAAKTALFNGQDFVVPRQQRRAA